MPPSTPSTPTPPIPPSSSSRNPAAANGSSTSPPPGLSYSTAALQLLELDRELLSYWQQELAAKNIGPVEFLGKRKDFLEKESGIERLRDRLRELEAEVRAKAHFFEQ